MSEYAASRQRGWRISFGKRRAAAARRNASAELRRLLLGGYEPLNPDTFEQPRRSPPPFKPTQDQQ
ncbi:MAG: hypothetical protein HXY40_12675 [Chloroflexi bacterium]|nr:hypothetical protein [Chloroflexota bacterium]